MEDGRLSAANSEKIQSYIACVLWPFLGAPFEKKGVGRESRTKRRNPTLEQLKIGASRGVPPRNGVPQNRRT